MTKILLFGFAVLLYAHPFALHAQPKWRFEEVSEELDLGWRFELSQGQLDGRDIMSGGLAAADFNRDGWVDLYVPRGDARPGLLLLNLGDGGFRDVAEQWNIQVSGEAPMSYAIGASFADIDGNGYPDLVLAGIREFGLRLYLNDGRGFSRAGPAWRLTSESQDQYSVAVADVNRDDRLDLAVGHWNMREPLGSRGGHLWLQTDDGFIDASQSWGVSEAFLSEDFSFTPNFADVTGDGLPDLLIAADFGTSQVFHNVGGNRFRNATSPAISDENGMGAAIGDFDGDGHLDWFVTSIWSESSEPRPEFGFSGNRLYRNRGDGRFADRTDFAGVRRGDWGWGACAMDFDNSGDLDLFHVNGFLSGAQPARLFMNRGDGTFSEESTLRGIADSGQGRGIVCFDYDRDGDIDVFIQNNGQAGRLYRNSAAENGNHWLGLRLRAYSANTEAIGARVKLTAGDLTQVREMTIPNAYLSTGPAEIHLGLAGAPLAERIEITWPDGSVEVHLDVVADRWLTVHQRCGITPVNADSRLAALRLRDCTRDGAAENRPGNRIRDGLRIDAGVLTAED